MNELSSFQLRLKAGTKLIKFSTEFYVELVIILVAIYTTKLPVFCQKFSKGMGALKVTTKKFDKKNKLRKLKSETQLNFENVTLSQFEDRNIFHDKICLLYLNE